MKKLGLLGGMTWRSTAEYYRIINEEVRRRLGGNHSASCVLYSLDFHDIAAAQVRGDWDFITGELVDAARSLRASGAELIILCANTIHKIADVVEVQAGVPVLHIADAAAASIKAKGLSKVGLLGTRYTMEQDFYKKRLREKHGLEVIIPGPEDIELVHNVIYDELDAGIFKEKSKILYKGVIDKLVVKGAQGIILGCTEIPLLVNQDDCNVPVFDTTYLHACAAVDSML